MRSPLSLASLALALAVSACNCGGVESEEDAKNAYLGLDKSVDRAMALGFAGFNAASSANIPSQSGSGDKSGTMTVSGQVDQGSSANKGMRLNVALDNYADARVDGGLDLTYATDGGTLPKLDLQLKNIPNGTFDGTLVGAFTMTGDLEGTVNLNLTLSGRTEEVPGQTGKVQRVAGSTAVKGTAISPAGTYQVDLSL